jgi:hypothetical protein
MGKRRPLFSAVAIGCAVLVASPSWAAVVEPGQGNLSINQGHGFKPVKKPINSRVGDSVMVGPGGAATVTYDDGCKVNVEPGAVTTIARLSPCASGSNAQQWPWECPPTDPAHPEQTRDCGLPGATLGFWAVWLGVTSFVGYEISQSGGTPATGRPASP